MIRAQNKSGAGIAERHYIDLLGRPFRSGARGPDAFDCLAVARLVYARWRGVPVESVPDPGLTMPDETTNPWERVGDRPASLRPGDFVLARNRDKSLHVWLALSSTRLVSAMKSRGVSTSSVSTVLRMIELGTYTTLGVYRLKT